MSSSFKAWVLLFIIGAALVTGGYWLLDRQGFVLGFFAALGLWGLSYFHGEKKIRDTFEGKILEGQDPWKLNEMVAELASHARIPKPKIIVLNLSTPTALSSGRSWLGGTIYVSEGLLKVLTASEIKAVLALEVAKIQRLDTFLHGVGAALSGFLIAATRLVDGFSSQNLVEKLFAPITSLPLKVFVSPTHYFASDAQAAQIIGDPKPLAQVLWKLHSCAGTRPVTELPSAAPLFTVNPLTPQNFHRYFDRQPPVERRIERLVGHFPI